MRRCLGLPSRVSTDPAANHALCLAALEKWGLWPVLIRVLGTKGWGCFLHYVGEQSSRHGYVEAHECHTHGDEKIYTVCVGAETSIYTASDPFAAICRAVVDYAETKEKLPAEGETTTEDRRR